MPGVLPMYVEVSVVSSVRITIKGTQHGKTCIALNVSSLESEVCDPTGVSGAAPMVWPLWDSYYEGVDGET